MGASFRIGTMCAVGRLVFSLAWFLGCGGLARAQAPPPPAPSMPAASVPVPETAPGYAAMPPQSATPPVEMGLLDTITESLFGDVNPEPSTWTPLPLGTFFTEGWLQPFVNAPNADGGAPRQGFLDSFDGLFYRQWATTFTYTNDFHRNGNQYFGSWTLWAPFNRRFEMRIDVPFIVSNKGGRSNSYHGNFGDLVVTPIFMLSESKNFTQTLSIFTSTATGKRANGLGVASVNPQYQFWAGLPDAWVVRGGFGPNVPTNDHGARTTMAYNLAIGKFVTPHDWTPFGDLVFYLAATGSSTMDNRGPSETLLFLTPGARCHLGNNWFVLAGVEVPVTGPRTQGFAWAPEFQVVKGF
jgi:hypothetical protein